LVYVYRYAFENFVRKEFLAEKIEDKKAITFTL